MQKKEKFGSCFCYDVEKATEIQKVCEQEAHNSAYAMWIENRPQKTNFQYQLNLVYYNNGYLTWNDGHKNYTASFKVGYKMGSWIPYMSIADYKGVDKTSSNRQIRWRWGLTYTF